MKTKNNYCSVKELMKRIKNGKVSFDNPVQRPSGQWNYQKKSLLIDSLLTMFIPEIFAIECDGKLDIIDGKQRLTTIFEFIKDEFTLEGLDNIKLPAVSDETYEINNKKFGQLHDDVREAIYSHMLSIKIVELEDGEDVENIVDDIFYRLNNGESVSKEHITFIAAKKNVQEFIRRIINEHPLFVSKCNFTANMVKKSNREMAILQSIILLSGLEYKSLAAKDVEDFFRTNTIEYELLQKVESAFDNLDKAFDVPNKYMQKTHIPFFAYISSNEHYKPFLLEYIKESKIGDEYRKYCGAGCIKKENVLSRIRGLDKMYNDYVERNINKNQLQIGE